MTDNTEEKHKHLRLAYILISTVLFLPVLILPALLFIFQNPMLPDILAPIWLTSIALLLMAAVSMDTILCGVSSFKQAIDAMLWVGIFAIIITSALQDQNNAFPLAILFLAHSIRSGYKLFISTNESKWWLWLAWRRDIIAAFTILFYSNLWGSFQ